MPVSPAADYNSDARDDDVLAAALRLASAATLKAPCAPVRDLLGTAEPELAYAVQRKNADARIRAGAAVVGQKIGLTSPAVQQQLGVDQPDYGLLFDDMACPPGLPVDIDRLLQPKIEAEVAFVLAADITDPEVTAISVRDSIAYAVAALEIIDSRIVDWDITFTDTVADNASSGLFVLGTERKSLVDFEPVDTVMTMSIDGQTVSTGRGDACLGDPLNALAWLARTAIAHNNPLRAGHIVLSGALGPMATVRPGARVEASISRLGSVTATFTDHSASPSEAMTSQFGADDHPAATFRDATDQRVKVAIIGSGNIGTDLMIKVMRLSKHLQMGAMVGIDPASDGLARAKRLGVPVVSDGVEGLIAMDGFDDIAIVFDATSAKAHIANAAKLAPLGKQLIDLTPAAIGPYVVPAVNLEQHLNAPNVNMVTCGGQATIPIVAAINRITPVHYGEIVASIASKSAGPGTRANIDEFTETTKEAIERVGGAARGKAIIVLNPADPPLIMRDTVLCLTDRLVESDREKVIHSIDQMIADVSAYVPGYRLKQQVQFRDLGPSETIHTLNPKLTAGEWTQVSVFLEVEGAAHYLPAYAGNLDIMTSAAMRVADMLAARAEGSIALATGATA